MSPLESCHSLRASFISVKSSACTAAQIQIEMSAVQWDSSTPRPFSLLWAALEIKTGFETEPWGKWGSFRPAAYSGQHKAQAGGEGGLSSGTAPGCSSLWLVLCLCNLCPRQEMPFLIVFKSQCGWKCTKFRICWILVPSAWPWAPFSHPGAIRRSNSLCSYLGHIREGIPSPPQI